MFLTKVLEERKSKFNGQLKVIKSFGLGTYIQAGVLTQSGGIINDLWKSTLRHVAYNMKHPVKNCLILGLGGGTIVKYITKNWPEAKITGVDIDPAIIELGKKYLKTDFSGVNIKISDAMKFISEQSSLSTVHYNLIIVDLYNGDQFPKKFESKQFLRLTRTVLAEDAIVIFNRLYYKEKKLEAEKFGLKLKKIFINVECYRPVTNIMFFCTSGS